MLNLIVSELLMSHFCATNNLLLTPVEILIAGKLKNQKMARNFNMSAAKMFTTGRTHRGHFITYKADFIALDTDFNDPFETNWLASIEASEAYENAETRDDKLEKETEDVTAAMAESHKCYTGMKYFIEKAFAAKPTIQAQFGLGNFVAASQSQKEMGLFLVNLHTQSMVAQNNADLLSAGCTQARIDDILTLKNKLSTEDDEQNVFATAEPIATKGRTKQYNSSFSFDQKVNRASKVVFYGMPEELNLFLFPRHSEPAEIFNVLGKATDMANAPISEVQVKIMTGPAMPPIAITTTDINGDYGFAAIAPGNYVLEFSKPGYMTQNIPVIVPASGQVTVDVKMS